ncbi:MAG: cupin domain-containing protein [Clostridiales bacterium]|nr:cupin domain-containing protein [Clostridiales bacterium]
MIKTAGQQQVRVRENVRGGTGAVSFHDFLTEEDAFGAGHLFSRTVIPAGASIGEHQHEGEFEVYYLLSGQAEVLEGDEWVTLNKGDMHRCASGESHAIRNNGSQEAELIMLILYENAAHI